MGETLNKDAAITNTASDAASHKHPEDTLEINARTSRHVAVH